MVRVVRAEAEHRVELQLGEATREDDVPDFVGAETGGVAGVVDAGVAVVDFKKLLAVDLHEFLGRNAPDEIRVIEVEKHRLARRGALREHGIDGALHDLEGALGRDRRDEIPRVREVQVDRPAELRLGGRRGAFPRGGDFLTRNQQEAAGLVEERAIFGERLEADFLFAGGLALLDPIRAEAHEIFFEHGAAAALDDRALRDGRRLHLKPARALGEDVVLGHREEVVAFALVAIGDHLGVIVAVAP